MCRSGPNARRCEHNSTARYSASLLSARQRYYRKKGDTAEVDRLEEQKRKLALAQERFGDHVSPMDLPLSPDTEALLAHLSDNKLTPFIVGGSVRDSFSGMPNKDIDIEVYGGNVQDVVRALRKKYHVDQVGASFGVLKVVLPDGNDLDISLPRTDSKTGEGHQGFSVEVDGNMSLEDATSRRDFTLNAMMYSPEYGTLVDLHHGKEDMENKVLRHVSPAFAEDPLRVLRGFQFASRFNMDVHEDTIAMSRTLKSEAAELSDERIKVEWEKFYSKGQHPSKGMKFLSQTEWDTLYPGLSDVNDSTLGKRLDASYSHMRKQPSEERQKVMGAVIAQRMDPEKAQAFLSTTSITKKLASQSYALAHAPTVENTDTGVREAARSLQRRKVTLTDWTRMMRASNPDMAKKVHRRAKRLGILDGPTPDALTGQDFLSVTEKKPGPWIGKLQREMRDAQDAGRITSREDAVTWLKNHPETQ